MQLIVNGVPTELAPGSFESSEQLSTALAGFLQEREWQLFAAVFNGAPVDRGDMLPAIGTSSDDVLEITAGPAEVSVDELQEQLRDCLPKFHEKANQLGEAFSRGDWQQGLPQISALCEELQFVLGGLQMIAAARGESAQHVEPLSGVLEDLVAHIQSQSWVEVSDLLLYELAPLLEQWQEV